MKYIHEKEQKLVEFCQQNEIPILVDELDERSQDRRVYSITFNAEYLDATEKNVVEFCKKHDIKYTFAIDSAGNHHYNFLQLVDVHDYSIGEEIYYRAWAATPSGEPLLYPEVLDEEIQPQKTFWQKICAFFGWEHKETEQEKSDRENLEFINSLGHTQEDLLKLGMPTLLFPKHRKD
jgi:hypothetical protein